MVGDSDRNFKARLVAYLHSFGMEAPDLHRWLLREMKFWWFALFLGIASGMAAVWFQKGIKALQEIFYGTGDMSRLHSVAEGLPWYLLVIIPVIGGLAVGLILHFFTKDGRSQSVAEVIEGAALHEGRVEYKTGIASALASMITLGAGGSSGREGPVVHIGAVISSWVSDRLRVDGITGRDLLGCAVAAAVSASFNSPIAGAIFALEVVLRHFAVHSFGPIVLASVAGTVVHRLHFGEVREFILPNTSALQFYVELPAFFLLGLLCGLVASILISGIFIADDVGTALQNKLKIPRFLRPMMAGLLLGIIAIWFPPIIGVGSETTANALMGRLDLSEVIIIAIVKVVAVAITLGGRMGGGVFSPSLMLGALTGLAFGHIATAILPEVSGEPTVYALAGMGAVAAAVLGAPISTIMIVFEMTGNWQIGLAVMAAVSTSVTLGARLVKRSFFLTVLERRNIHLAAGPQVYLLGMYNIARIMRPLGDKDAQLEKECWELIEQGFYVDAAATLEGAMPVLERANTQFIPVVTLGGEDSRPELQGVLYYMDALKIYNKAMVAVSEEEHS